MTEWRPDLVQAVIDALRADNMRVFLAAKIFEGRGDLVEKHYNISYQQERIPEGLLKV